MAPPLVNPFIIVIGCLVMGCRHVLCQESGCAAPSIGGPPLSEVKLYKELSSALLIFSNLTIPCSGHVFKWNFISNVQTADAIHLSVWRPMPDSPGTFQLIADVPLKSLGVSVNQWNSYTHPPIPVQAGDVLGMFYDSWLLSQTKVVVPYADIDSLYAAGVSPDTVPLSSTHIAFINAGDIYSRNNITGLATSLKENRIPALQAVVKAGSVPPTAGPPGPSTAPPTNIQRRCFNRIKKDADFGNCPGSKLVRFYFSQQSSKCIGFRGCANPDPLSNNFCTKEACQQLCISDCLTNRCSKPPVGGLDFGPTCSAVRFYYNSAAKVCKQFKGCPRLQGNNFATMQECGTACGGGSGGGSGNFRCSLRPRKGVDFGSCGSTPRFYWSSQIGKCIKFLGCISNQGNNWATQGECASTCAAGGGPFPPINPESLYKIRCTNGPIQKVDFGDCPGVKSVRWYFKPGTGGCNAFSGCVGQGGNNFPSRAACGTICGGVPEATRAGRCRANPSASLYGCNDYQRKSNRTWFDNADKKCKKFPYNVCVVAGGNNFDNTADCQSFCKSLM